MTDKKKEKLKAVVDAKVEYIKSIERSKKPRRFFRIESGFLSR
jgi:hypothetical protein